MAITSTQQTEILKIVSGLFNAAPGGTYLTELSNLVQGGMTTSQLADALAAHSLFTGTVMAGKVTIASQVNVLMNNFGLTADSDPASAGSQAQAYFTQQINANVGFGKIVYDAVQFLSGSVPPEFTTAATLLSNKALVAAAYSEKTSSTSLTTLQTVLGSVTGTAAYTTTDVTAVLNAIGGGGGGQTFTLTTGVNKGSSFAGGSGDDDFDGSFASGTQTLNSGDSLDGGDGTDSLTAQINASVTPVALKSIENVTLTNSTTASVVDLTNATGLSTVTNQGSTVGLTVQGISNGVGFTLQDTSTAAQVVTYNDVTGSTDSATISLKNVSGGATLSALGVETLTLNSSSANNTLATLTATQATTLVVTGDKQLTVTNNLESNIATVNSSAATGKVDVDITSGNATVTGGSGNDVFSFETTAGAVSVNGGAGNDTVTFDGTATLTTDDTVNGGDGTDTLTSTDDELQALTVPSTGAVITNFETVKVSNALDNSATLTVANIQAGISKLTLAAGLTGGAVTVAMEAGSKTVEIEAALAQGLTINDTGTATTDSLRLDNTAESATDVFDGQSITVGGFETVTVDTGDFASVTGNIDINALAVTADNGGTATVNFVGAASVDTAGNITAAVIDASGLGSGAALTMAAAAASNTSITGSSGNDTLLADADGGVLAGNAGDDVVTGGAGNDTLNGNDGADTITSAAGNDSVNGGAGNDRVVMAGNLTSADTVVGGANTDTLAVTTGADISAANASGVSEFEKLEVTITGAHTLTLSNFLNNTGFTQIDAAGGADALLTLANVGANVTTLGLVNAIAADSVSFSRLVDTSANSLDIILDVQAGTTVAAITASNEETITVSGEESTDDLVVTAMTAADLTTLNITGAGDVSLAAGAGIVSATSLATVDASTATGAVVVNATNSAVNMTVTAGTGGLTVTTGAGADTVTGSVGADVVVGGTGNDTISVGAGNDNVTGGVGADTITVGSGTDTVTYSATGETFASAITSGSTVINGAGGVDVINGLAAGDVISLAALTVNAYTAAATAILTSIISAGTNGDISMVVGTYNATTGIWLTNAAGTDTLLQWDSNGTAAAGNIESVVLVGYVTTGTSSSTSDGVITLA